MGFSRALEAKYYLLCARGICYYEGVEGTRVGEWWQWNSVVCDNNSRINCLLCSALAGASLAKSAEQVEVEIMPLSQ